MALLLGSASLAHAQAAAPMPPEPPPTVVTPDLTDVAKRLRGFITDEEMTLLYDFMSDSAVAALGGGEVAPLPPELEFKLAILRERLYKEGNAVMEGFMQFLHNELDQTLKKFKLPSLTPEPNPPASLPEKG